VSGGGFRVLSLGFLGQPPAEPGSMKLHPEGIFLNYRCVRILMAALVLIVTQRGTRPRLGNRPNIKYMKPLVCLFSVLAFVASGSLSGQTPEIIEAAWKKTVTIRVYDRYFRFLGTGSGFIVGDKGEIATNHHVIDGAAHADARFPDNDKAFPVSGILRQDKLHDLAVIRIDLDTVSLPFGNNDDYRIGEKIISIGSPLGLSGTVSDGIISGRHTVLGFEHMQINTAVSPGSSGGPVINEKGEVIGVVVGSILSGQNLNFAVPVKHLKNLLAAP
jgi:S1-C subfamily serine protease